MRHMGGLRKYAPITFWTLLTAALAISGIPPFAGFWSKDAILVAAYQHAPWMFWVGAVTAGMTAFYVFRAMFMTFFGEYRGHGHPHESPFSMWGPLAALSVLSVVGGYLFNVPKILEGMFPLAEEPDNPMLLVVSIGVGVLGIATAWYMYVVKTELPARIAASFSGLYNLIYNKYFVDEIYDAAIVHPIVTGSRSVLWHGMDQGVIDGIVNGVGTQSQSVGGVLKLLQSGNIRSYATWVVLGAVGLLIVMGITAISYAAGVGQ
jgi:NADH-quinone oxidoreductase subunit L